MATSDYGALIGDAATAYALIGGTVRTIGTLMPNVAVEEVHHDTAVLTQHPTETGSPVTDHVFIMPQIVELRWAWSDSFVGAVGYANEVYQALLALQQTRKGFPISTAKRQYENMQIVSLTAKTDIETPNALLPIAVCQQIIQVDVQTTAGTTSPNTDGNSGVGNTATDKPSASDLAAANAANSGYAAYDPKTGNVSFPNGTATGGTVQLQGLPTAPQWGDPITPVTPSSFSGTMQSISAGGTSAYPSDITGFSVSGVSP